MEVIGIVGGIGAGKSTVVKMIESIAEAYVIGVDEIGHKILLKDGPAYKKVVETFGEDLLDEDYQIVRSRLADIVFSDSKLLEKLNQITHPLIFEAVKKEIEWCLEQKKWQIIIIDAALLIEIGLVELTDEVWAVYASEELRAERIMQRNGYTYEQAIQRIRSQKSWEIYEKMADTMINNEGGFEQTNKIICKLISNKIEGE